MSNCLCLACDRSNSITTKFCSQCGSKLQIQERYRALKAIGQGGFGKTFLAQDEGKPSKPRCVIKQFLYDDPATLREAQRLFEQEAVRLDDLGRHPQIPELLAHCEQEGRQYLVQEFIDGENLLQELNRAGRFSEAKIKDLLLDLLPVLQFIHAGQVIHRDIKPENIIRRRSDGRLVVVDFGAAKMASQTALQKTGTTIGSAGYAAPEQAFGKALFASDIYSLGVSCLHLITNVNPLTMYDPVEGFAWRDFLVNQKVSNELGQILDKMTQPSVKQRYQSVAETLQAMQPKALQPSKPSFWGLFSQPSQSTILTSSNSLSLILDCGKGTKLELIKVSAGSFDMGSDKSNPNEKPIHRVNLREFFIGKYPVTQAQYRAVMGKNPSDFKGDQNPVERVSWDDASKFCQKLSQKTGQKVRLPSEAEWEYAAKGGNQTKGCEYAGSNNLDEVGWYSDNSDRKTHLVGQKKANELGIYDMSGNVWEWCLDNWYNEGYENKPDRLKNNGNEPWVEMNPIHSHSFRGGSWNDDADICRSSVRIGCESDYRYYFLGFRVVI
jgi:formylglycine-generating enzyme required for sulfatase activity